MRRLARNAFQWGIGGWVMFASLSPAWGHDTTEAAPTTKTLPAATAEAPSLERWGVDLREAPYGAVLGSRGVQAFWTNQDDVMFVFGTRTTPDSQPLEEAKQPDKPVRHSSRTAPRLRKGLLFLSGKTITISDWKQLKQSYGLRPIAPWQPTDVLRFSDGSWVKRSAASTEPNDPLDWTGWKPILTGTAKDDAEHETGPGVKRYAILGVDPVVRHHHLSLAPPIAVDTSPPSADAATATATDPAQTLLAYQQLYDVPRYAIPLKDDSFLLWNPDHPFIIRMDAKLHTRFHASRINPSDHSQGRLAPGVFVLPYEQLEGMYHPLLPNMDACSLSASPSAEHARLCHYQRQAWHDRVLISVEQQKRGSAKARGTGRKKRAQVTP